MAQKKKIELTRLQGIIAVASFSSGVIIASVCLFFIPPLGEIASSAISIVSELLVLCGANLFTRLNYWIVACGGQPSVTPPELVGVENPSSATIVCQGETFTFKLDQALADNGGIYLVIEATEGQSNGVTRAHAKASGIKLVEEPTDAAIDIRADYVAKYGAPSAAAPKIFFRYYYVNSSTGEKSGTMLAECKWTAANAGGEP